MSKSDASGIIKACYYTGLEVTGSPLHEYRNVYPPVCTFTTESFKRKNKLVFEHFRTDFEEQVTGSYYPALFSSSANDSRDSQPRALPYGGV